MKSRAALTAIERDLEALRNRVAQANQPAILLLERDGTPQSEAALEEAMTGAAAYDGYTAVAVIVDLSAGSQLLPEDDPDLLTGGARLHRIVRRIVWENVFAVPGVRPGRDNVAGRPIYGWHGTHRVYGLTVDGEPVGLDSAGPYVLEPLDG